MNIYEKIYRQIYNDFLNGSYIDYQESEHDYIYINEEVCISYKEAIDNIINRKFGGDVGKALKLYTDGFSKYLKMETEAIIKKKAFYLKQDESIQILPAVTHVRKPYVGYVQMYTYLNNFQPQI